MPNYDIIPLATDLLEYTIQRVRAKDLAKMSQMALQIAEAVRHT